MGSFADVDLRIRVGDFTENYLGHTYACTQHDKGRRARESRQLPADYIIDKDTRTIRLVLYGRLTVAEMYDGRHRMMSDSAFDRAFSQLVDARPVETFEMNGYTIKQFAQEHVFAPGARRAIVMTKLPDLGLARMFQIYRRLAGGTETIELFSDIDKARGWLGLPSD